MGALALLCGLILAGFGCAAAQPAGEGDDDAAPPQRARVHSAAELIAFFEEGGAEAELAADIDLQDAMLKLEPGRGDVHILGKGHTISGSAPCIIRVCEDGSIRLQALTIRAEKTGIGLLGGGEIAATDSIVAAGSNAIQAAGALRLRAGASLEVSSETGAGILCVGLILGEGSRLQAQGDLFAISAGRGDILLEAGAHADCAAAGDNAIKTDAALDLRSGSLLAVRNTSDHNAAKIGTLEAAADATLELTGGENGVGLFIVEQYQDVTVRGFCRPEQKVEVGKGSVEFTE